MRVGLLRLSAIWVCVTLYCQEGHGLRNRVYLEADKNCGQVKTLEVGEHFIVGSKHGGQEILKENCDITFKLANQKSKDRICIEFEQLDFKGNCYASLSVIDVIEDAAVDDDVDGSVYSVAREEKQVGLFSCMREPPLEMCSSGQTLKIHLDRGYHMLDRELVVFLLEIYTKNPDARPTDSPFEEANTFWFFGDEPAPVLLLVIIALCLVITITATVIVICMRLKSRTTRTQVPIQPEYTRANGDL
ncbi:uncharacterized protein LOC121368837 [Gigantopelta aegis]|uniref:uncharacterized protein LOC121368837 n=1 Tax=Gigantopelta aegis TaxID=1735272 RepID=UPI001B887620|nr:uncharacterized protein LOC121368837 [Gigantopelta aegis]